MTIRTALIGAVTTAVLLSGCAAVPATADDPQRCNAAASQSLIGSHVGAVSFASDANVRVVCTTCAVTLDYDAGRLNVFFDQETGIIKKVSCG